jgi:hypothetical protein
MTSRGGKDTITTSQGPSERSRDSLDDRSGDRITTLGGESSPNEPYQGSFKGAGDRDWTDVHNRIVTVSGVNINTYGDIEYTEEGDISVEDVNKVEAEFTKAGAQPGQGKAVAEAAKQMGYGIKFTARKAQPEQQPA